MITSHVPRSRPPLWSERKQNAPHAALVPLLAFDWVWDWIAYFLGNWKFLEVLEYLGRFTVLVAVVLYFSESGDRVKQRHYQAWQVINTAQGKGGNGGRIEALQELNHDGVSLLGVNVAGAYLSGIHLERANLERSNFSAADLRKCDFRGVDFNNADLHAANFRECNFEKASLEWADLDNADLWGANLAGADLSNASLDNAALNFTNLKNAQWLQIRSVKQTNLFGVKNAPEGFVDWALAHGAVRNDSQSEFDPQ